MKIVVLDSDAVPGVTRGPGSPAYFSRFAIRYLQQRGHDVTILDGFDSQLCAAADVVWTEWSNQPAFDAAASGVCKKLVIRQRGYDVWTPLSQLAWQNVDCLVYESSHLQELACERFPALKTFNTRIIASGLDLKAIPFREREKPPWSNLTRRPVVALVARATADKGHALALEWARRADDLELHVTTALGELNPRFVRYLERLKPTNVTIHGNVDTIPWLEEIGADFMLSASDWETLGYSIAEACAMGIKPLIHDAPGCAAIWPADLLWRGFDDLDELLVGPYESARYRKYVEDNLDAEKQSAEFAELILSPPQRAQPTIELQTSVYDEREQLLKAVYAAVSRPVNMAPIVSAAEAFRHRFEPHTPDSLYRYCVATGLAAAFYNNDDLAHAEQWACRALQDYARPDALAILGEVADKRGDIEEAVQWYKAACAVEDLPNKYRLAGLADKRFSRMKELERKLVVKLPPAQSPDQYLVVVTVRNGEPWIGKCLASITRQSLKKWHCIVVDDASTDGTADTVNAFIHGEAHVVGASNKFSLVRNEERKWQARNTIEVARLAVNANDVVILIDGDDQLSNDDAFATIDLAYQEGAWATYGGCVSSNGDRPVFGIYPQRIARAGNFQDWLWCATAPRTFKKFLLDQLTDEDFQVNGEWPKVAGDVAVFMPMMQMACERVVGISRLIYEYNVSTPDSDHKQNAREQVRVRDLLFARPPKKRFERP